jgi:phage shock protein A
MTEEQQEQMIRQAIDDIRRAIDEARRESARIDRYVRQTQERIEEPLRVLRRFHVVTPAAD